MKKLTDEEQIEILKTLKSEIIPFLNLYYKKEIGLSSFNLNQFQLCQNILFKLGLESIVAGCSSCLKSNLDILYSYYERESKKFDLTDKVEKETKVEKVKTKKLNMKK